MKKPKLDSSIMNFMELAVGDQVYFRFPWLPDATHYRGFIIWRNDCKITVRWNSGFEASFTLGITGGWNLVTKVAKLTTEPLCQSLAYCVSAP